MEKITEKSKSKIIIKPAGAINIQIDETMDFNANAARNRIWYRGDSSEIEQLYSKLSERKTLYNFWAAKSSPGMEIRKIHTGIPGITVDTLSSVVLTDLNDIKFKNDHDKEIWENIAKENKFSKLIENALKEALYIGDGAFKITYDASLSDYPIIEYYPGDQIDFKVNRGRIKEVVFRTPYKYKDHCYVLHETYGYGYIKNRLMKDEKEVPLNAIPDTADLSDFTFAGYRESEKGDMASKGSYMMAVPLMVFKSSKYKNRGQSVFDRKVDAYDALDEAWSQWMDALRAGRSKEYIPETLLPRNPDTGLIMKPNAFDCRYIKTDSDMREGVDNKIQLDQPSIPHDSYLATYCTALDMCLQGLISPSTIGIDVKKLDNAEAQREKEKTTLYTRNAIVETLTEDLKELVKASVNVYKEINKIKIDLTMDPDVTFGEYANPSFESQVETVSKARTGNIMSIEAGVDELYGDTRDDDWKKEEVARLKAEQGITTVEEPSVNESAGEFVVNGFAGAGNE
ncbi:MAG: capsid protein [Agathobacter sp.]